MQPAFSKKMIAVYADVMRSKAEEMVSQWRVGQTIDIQAAADDVTLGIGVATLFDAELGRSAAETVKECAAVVMRGALTRTLLPDFVYRLPLPGVRRLADAERRLRKAFEGIIEHYRTDGDDHGDVLTMLLAARDDSTGEGMTDIQVLDELVSLALGSLETTSSVLASLFLRLSSNPAIGRRVHAEIDSVLPENRSPTKTWPSLGTPPMSSTRCCASTCPANSSCGVQSRTSHSERPGSRQTPSSSAAFPHCT